MAIHVYLLLPKVKFNLRLHTRAEVGCLSVKIKHLAIACSIFFYKQSKDILNECIGMVVSLLAVTGRRHAQVYTWHPREHGIIPYYIIEEFSTVSRDHNVFVLFKELKRRLT